ncbi:hypothetical protein [Pseudoalteromonas luteoviolacea]|uniref:Uncharacterized protein n=1 Tax=Pseudoalteromonas luteoviolacea S4054 TaxID=1129367 RepID=A0A0F6ABG7_9GAMM|nr:hypothetical protein [Pseudoalteromonas luteoviolacea]AOT08521.1 hypothetical protein S4054249_11975 [Pseudoalteromonas luteoviolacea]AOT13437.1 hypothetical protein S40542_11950 [Pseudoalteromonas luteoviolacea]AOT18350.1 hypothetical protein S4054_11950 [Pseudoalteromonas luteoviolacea]KKE83483.1 hypothetical protein N479_14015 [Pseudoalteromonas luteoviolacea S4054]KZN75920.1 hypothetical protein N481_06110 [Pseudoalteromonas luteoviolacea S4047-1]
MQTREAKNASSSKELMHKSLKSPLLTNINGLQSDPSFKKSETASIVSEELGRPQITTLSAGAVNVNILSSGVHVARDYALQMLWSEASIKETVKHTISGLLTYAITSIKSLSPWLAAIVKAIDVIASIPKGVISAVLWAFGKIWLWAANKLYNGGWIAHLRGGDVTESYIFGILEPIESAHSKLKDFVDALKNWVESIQNALTSKLTGYIIGSQNDDEVDNQGDDLSQKEEAQSHANLVENQFISLGLNPPKLGEWDEVGHSEKRAGLKATGLAQVSLMGQKLGGDIEVNLPFGSGWELTIAPVFESSSIDLSDYIHVDKVMGDKLVLDDDGLSFFGASIHGLSVAKGKVKSDKIALSYNKGQDEVHFNGDAHVPLWAEKQLDGEFDLKMDTTGKFKSGRAKVSSSSTFKVIPEYLSISNPEGEVSIKENASPEFEIGTDVSLYGLPKGVTASLSKAKVTYHDEHLGGEIAQADVTIPISQHTKMTLAMTKAKFTKDKIEAETAFMDLEHDSSKVLNEDDVVESSLFTESSSLKKVFDLKQLTVHQGLSSLKFEGGKFTYEKDENNGIQSLRARVLGLEAYYDNKKKKGGISGEWKQGVSIPALNIDVPLVAGIAGVGIEVTGGFEVKANVGLDVTQLEKNEQASLYEVTGKVGAGALAKARIDGFGFIGLPYLAKLQASIFGELSGEITGDVSVTGGLKYTNGRDDQAFGHFGMNEESPIEGNFKLHGEVNAAVGAALKAKALFFEKQLASMTFGNWKLGEYTLEGTIEKDESGKGYQIKRNASQQNVFTQAEVSESEVKPIDQPVDKWISTHKQENNDIEYENEGQAQRKISEVVRKTLFDVNPREKRPKLLNDYGSLLKDKKQKAQFDKLRSMMETDQKVVQGDSYIWSPKVWDNAVQRRKILYFFEQSDSKAKVSEQIEKYHKTDLSKVNSRRAILKKIEEIVIEYKDKKSKSELNKAIAEDFLQSIEQERFIYL